jgi:thiamine-phosphate pyrophosphorylase
MNRSLASRLSLIVVTDAEQTAGRALVDVVQAALQGGAPSVQLRAKHASAREMVALAHTLLPLTRAAGALLWVNDRMDVALAAGVDGAHLGDDDLPLEAARRIAPEGFLLGRSVDTPELARAAVAAGADYLGVGPAFATGSKSDAGQPIGIEGVERVAASVEVPVVAIGGIDATNTARLAAAGAAGVAVIRAVMAAPDVESATRALLGAVAEGQRARGRG